MATPAAHEFGPRLRAALALKGWTVSDLADELPPEYRLSKETLYALQQARRAPKEWEIPLIAERLGVPDWFLAQGLSRESREPAAADGPQPLAEDHRQEAQRLLGEVQRLLEELAGSG